MLVLSRKKGEAIHVDGPATIIIVDTGGRRVGVGIEAPPTTRAIRTELETLPKPLDTSPTDQRDIQSK